MKQPRTIDTIEKLGTNKDMKLKYEIQADLVEDEDFIYIMFYNGNEKEIESFTLSNN